jgi:hypothetical protein
MPGHFRAVAVAVALVIAAGCDFGGRNEDAGQTTTVADKTVRVVREEPLSSSVAANAVDYRLRNDRRGKPVEIDCTADGDPNRMVCNVEFENACDVFRVERQPLGNLVVRRGEGICLFSTETTVVGG